jgi:hypothetical protein
VILAIQDDRGRQRITHAPIKRISEIQDGVLCAAVRLLPTVLADIEYNPEEHLLVAPIAMGVFMWVVRAGSRKLPEPLPDPLLDVGIRLRPVAELVVGPPPVMRLRPLHPRMINEGSYNQHRFTVQNA